MNRLKFILIALIFIMATTGCFEDSREIDHRTLITGMAVDIKEDKFLVTIQVPILEGGDEQGNSQGTEFETFQAEGETLWDAVAQIEAYTPTVLFFGHTKVIAISEVLAKELGLKEVIDLLERLPAVANQVFLIIIEGQKAGDFLSQESQLVSLPSLYLSSFFQADQKIARTVDIKLFEFRRESNMISSAAVIPIARLIGEIINIEDLAVFKDYKLVAKLRTGNVGVSVLLKDEEVGSLNHTVKLDYNGQQLNVALSRVKLTANISFNRELPVTFTIDVKGKGKIVETNDIEVRITQSIIDKVTEQVENDFEEIIRETVGKLKKKNVEPWLLGHRIWLKDYPFFEKLAWEKTGWQESKLNVNVSFEVTSAGQKGYLEKKKIGR
ncbi:Ger(x)C family spore germination protein [Bacillaceae bacterium IKA-2]|nr:Ger(x)C family spore germination protein [Bacillaceae bacterium IKA-2]